jgi:hypothetical protein
MIQGIKTNVKYFSEEYLLFIDERFGRKYVLVARIFAGISRPGSQIKRLLMNKNMLLN